MLRNPAASLVATVAVVGALLALTFGVLGLGHFAPRALIALGVIATGAALLGRGGLIIAAQAHGTEAPGATDANTVVGEAAGDEVLGGAGAIVCGVLALVGIAPALLLGVSLMSAGSATLLSAWSYPRLGTSRLTAASVVMTITGVAAMTLGVLVVTITGPAYTLLAIGVLVLGGALLGAALAVDALSAMRARESEPLDVARTNPLAL